MDIVAATRSYERGLIRAMGAEAANVHLGGLTARIRADVKARPRRWLARVAVDMADAVEKDFRTWVRARTRG